MTIWTFFAGSTRIATTGDTTPIWCHAQDALSELKDHDLDAHGWLVEAEENGKKYTTFIPVDRIDMVMKTETSEVIRREPPKLIT